MAELKEDPFLYPAMVALAGCVCEEMGVAGLDTSCFCGVMPGAVVDGTYVMPDGGTDMAWVRLVGTALAESATLVRSNCNTPLDVTLEVGFGTCAVIPEGAELITVDEQLAMARRVMAGMQAAKRAILCCEWFNKYDATMRMGTWTPLGPEGGFVGGTWQLLLAVD